MCASGFENFNDPYQVGGGLSFNHPTYVKRGGDTDLYQRLKKGEFCYVFNSRQVGKSSLRLQIMYHLRQEGITCVSIDLTNMGTVEVTSEQWYCGLCFELARKLQLRKILNLKQWWQDWAMLSPVLRFTRFIEEIVLSYIETELIIICFDEVDSVLSLDFSMDDFFAAIRYFYHQRAENPIYNRLGFALFGVTTPPKLMQDKSRTPFNLGKAITLSEFRLEETSPLKIGLINKAKEVDLVLKLILMWTGGQPFLTQKLCQLVALNSDYIKAGEEAEKVEKIARSRIIENWEMNDEPQHLRAIRDRVLYYEKRQLPLLKTYQQILTSSYPSTSYSHFPPPLSQGIIPDNSPEQAELLLSGLVLKNQQGLITVRNPIYAEVFNLNWLQRHLVISNK
ncbi:MAG: AAA-like domain-containing protein [Halothece sp.]